MTGCGLDELLRKDKLELVKMLLEKDDILVPASIFSQKSGPLESLVAYLKEKKNLPVKEIALRLNRSKQTIWATYYKAKRLKISFEATGPKIPLSIFSKKQSSILESLTFYLKNINGLRLSEIAALLRRDIRTVWTCNKRFENKNPALKNQNNKNIIKEVRK